jgi:hypothetical protein
MIDISDLARYGQSRVILDALTRAGNRQAQFVEDAIDREGEMAKYYAVLEAANQAQLACDHALLAIARAVVASDTPFADASNMLNNAGIDSPPNAALAIDIVAELRAITKEAQ